MGAQINGSKDRFESFEDFKAAMESAGIPVPEAGCCQLADSRISLGTGRPL